MSCARIIIHCALYVGFPKAIAAIQTVKRIQEVNPTVQTYRALFCPPGGHR